MAPLEVQIRSTRDRVVWVLVRVEGVCLRLLLFLLVPSEVGASDEVVLDPRSAPASLASTSTAIRNRIMHVPRGLHLTTSRPFLVFLILVSGAGAEGYSKRFVG